MILVRSQALPTLLSLTQPELAVFLGFSGDGEAVAGGVTYEDRGEGEEGLGRGGWGLGQLGYRVCKRDPTYIYIYLSDICGLVPQITKFKAKSLTEHVFRNKLPLQKFS